MRNRLWKSHFGLRPYRSLWTRTSVPAKENAIVVLNWTPTTACTPKTTSIANVLLSPCWWAGQRSSTYLVRRLLKTIITTLARPRTYSTLQTIQQMSYISTNMLAKRERKNCNYVMVRAQKFTQKKKITTNTNQAGRMQFDDKLQTFVDDGIPVI